MSHSTAAGRLPRVAGAVVGVTTGKSRRTDRTTAPAPGGEHRVENLRPAAGLRPTDGGWVLEFEDVPPLRDPVLIAAFEGWNDAGEAASAVVEHLAAVWDAEAIAALDPEDYYDFQVNRPKVL